MEIVGYIRGHDYENQIKEIEKYIEGKDITIKKFYLDKNGPGTRISERSAYQKLLDESNSWETLIIPSLETIHTDIRNMFDFLAFLIAFKKNLISLEENINDRSFLLGAYSLKRIYDSDTGNYVPKVVAHKAHLDTWIGRPPYGYRIMQLDNDRKILEPREAESMVVKFIFEERARGLSYNGISDILNKKGIPATRKGKRWTYVKIMRILDNKIYWGYREIYNDMGDRMWVRHDYRNIISEDLGRKVYMTRATRKERKK